MLLWMPALSALHPQLPPTNPPTHSTLVLQRPSGRLDGGRERGRRVCVCVCVDSGVERVRKKERERGGLGLELQHSVLFISTVSHGTLGKWNVCSSGWLQHWPRPDWSWLLRTEHIAELTGERAVEKRDICSMNCFPSMSCHAKSQFSTKIFDWHCIWNVWNMHMLGSLTTPLPKCIMCLLIFRVCMLFCLPSHAHFRVCLYVQLWVFTFKSTCLCVHYQIYHNMIVLESSISWRLALPLAEALAWHSTHSLALLNCHNLPWGEDYSSQKQGGKKEYGKSRHYWPLCLSFSGRLMIHYSWLSACVEPGFLLPFKSNLNIHSLWFCCCSPAL